MPTRYTAPLPVPHKDLVAVRLARIAARSVKNLPRTRKQARKRFERYFDRRFIATRAGREQLNDHWSRIARLASRLPGTAGIVAGTSNYLTSRLRTHGHSESARELLDAVGRTLPESDDTVTMRAVARVLDLSLGKDVDDTAELTAESLALADAALGRGHLDEAAARLQTAFELSLHRVHHFEDKPSPYALDPDTFLRPFRQSPTFQAVVTPTHRSRPAREPADTEGGRPHRILFAT
ncbi:MAG TPA: hypothetical protein VFY88_08460, partial [Intrasporangium sp.]|nr:hypothetical protein [Intrasporangium sp.]